MLQVVDTHQHLWDLRHLPHAWLDTEDPNERAVIGDYASIRHDYLAPDYLRDIESCGVSHSVHIEAACSGDDPVQETAWLSEIAATYGYPHALVVACDLASSDAASVLDRHCEYPNVWGVRTFASGDDLLAEAFTQGVTALSSRGLGLELTVYCESMTRAAALIHQFPNMTFTLAHAGMPMQRDDEYMAVWRGQLRKVADYANVTVKISGLGMADHAWTPATIRPWVLSCIDTFGTERCVFGSNWPVDSLYSSYRRLVEAYRSVLAELTVGEQRRILSENALKLYRITLESDAQ